MDDIPSAPDGRGNAEGADERDAKARESAHAVRQVGRGGKHAF